MELVEVIIWDKLVGVLVWDDVKMSTRFEFSKAFVRENIQLSPLITSLSDKIITASTNQKHISTENLNFDTDKGLPLFISDSLPDKFGTDLFSKYLEKEGRSLKDLSPLEKLTYIGKRGMGALEFRPSKHNQESKQALNLITLDRLSESVIKGDSIGNTNEMVNLFHIGTSPGGAQPKVLANIDSSTGLIYRGDSLPTGSQESWIIKFNKNIGLDSDKERGKVEYAYYLMAREAKITFMESALKELEGEHYFMTKRFDRIEGQKIHTQTLHAFAGMHFNYPNTYSYEQVFSILNQINLEYRFKEQLFRMMVFNIIGRNVDDHTKNFGFNLKENGNWELSPAYDLTFTLNENYNRETPHFLSVNGKNNNFKLEDLLKIATEYSIKNPKKIINEINQSFLKWESIADRLQISDETKNYILSKLNTMPYLIK